MSRFDNVFSEIDILLIHIMFTKTSYKINSIVPDYNTPVSVSVVSEFIILSDA
jgi:hypothetical protein